MVNIWMMSAALSVNWLTCMIDMTRRKWKLGLLVSALTGILTGVGALAVGVTWKQAAWIIGGTVGKDMLLYLQNPTYREQVLSSLPSNDSDPRAFVKANLPDGTQKP